MTSDAPQLDIVAAAENAVLTTENRKLRVQRDWARSLAARLDQELMIWQGNIGPVDPDIDPERLATLISYVIEQENERAVHARDPRTIHPEHLADASAPEVHRVAEVFHLEHKFEEDGMPFEDHANYTDLALAQAHAETHWRRTHPAQTLTWGSDSQSWWLLADGMRHGVTIYREAIYGPAPASS